MSETYMPGIEQPLYFQGQKYQVMRCETCNGDTSVAVQPYNPELVRKLEDCLQAGGFQFNLSNGRRELI
jgi:hypothetical protein